MKQKFVKDRVVSIETAAYLYSVKVKGFTLENLAMVSVTNTGKYYEIYNAMGEVLMSLWKI